MRLAGARRNILFDSQSKVRYVLIAVPASFLRSGSTQLLFITPIDGQRRW
uniref:Uncharacterized protein n=1 Tax=Arabidopsis thaliana TaxID=3702 RepID=Q56YK3_ARATH|nr:hypothetical protein [Arabidopsis thaliana]